MHCGYFGQVVIWYCAKNILNQIRFENDNYRVKNFRNVKLFYLRNIIAAITYKFLCIRLQIQYVFFLFLCFSVTFSLLDITISDVCLIIVHNRLSTYKQSEKPTAYEIKF